MAELAALGLTITLVTTLSVDHLVGVVIKMQDCKKYSEKDDLYVPGALLSVLKVVIVAISAMCVLSVCGYLCLSDGKQSLAFYLFLAYQIFVACAIRLLCFFIKNLTDKIHSLNHPKDE